MCGNQQQQPWRGHGRAADSYPGAPMDAPINPLLPKAGREWERLRSAPLCPLTARLILGAFSVDEGWMSQPADRCRISDVTAPSGNGATTKSSVGYGENGDPRGRIPVAPSLTQAGAEPPLAHRHCHILGFKLEQSFLRFPAALREASMDLSTGRRDEQTWSPFPVLRAWLVENRQNLGSPAGRLQDDSSATSRDEIRKFEV